MWEGQSLVEGLLVIRVNKEETLDDGPAPMFLGEEESTTATPPMLLLREDVPVEGRDGIGGGGPAGKLKPPSLLLKLKLRALFVPLQISPDRAGSGGASPSALPPSDSEVLPCCFFLNAKSYMSPKIPAKVFLRFFIVSSASSTTDVWDWVRPGAPPAVAAVAWDRLTEEVVEDCDA